MIKKQAKKKKNSVVGSKYLKELLRLGNFLVKRYGDGEFSYVRICTADGSWRMDFREDTMKYAWILMLASDTKLHLALEAWIVITFHAAFCNPDREFIDNMIKELHALALRAEDREKQRDDQQNSVDEKD